MLIKVQSSRIYSDFSFGEWRLDSETGKRIRQFKYKTITQSILGTNTVTCTEKMVRFLLEKLLSFERLSR